VNHLFNIPEIRMADVEEGGIKLKSGKVPEVAHATR
jgi:hypothetical protein